jgi:hypothetical protein
MQTRTLWLAGALIAFGPAMLAADPPAAPATPTAAAAAQAYTLRYKFKTGDVSYYKMTMDSNGTLGGPGGTSIPVKLHMLFFYHQTVSAVAADGTATLTTKFDSADLSSMMGGQATPGSDATVAELKSRTLTTTVSPTGKTTAVKTDGADGAASQGLDFSKMANFQGASLLPDAPVKAGDIWKSTIDLSSAMGTQIAGLQATVQSTLASVDMAAGKAVATINQTTAGQIDPADSAVMGMQMSVAGKVNGTGVIKFDTDSGFLVSQTATTSLNLTLTPKGDPGAAGGAGPIPVQFQIITDLEKVDASAVPKTAPTAPAAAPGPAGVVQ